MDLSSKKCLPCEGGIPALNQDKIDKYRKSIHTDWSLKKRNSRIERNFHFLNFKQTMEFVNDVARIAEEEGHHPVLHIGFNYCTIELWTHAIQGLSENDFILASKIDVISKIKQAFTIQKLQQNVDR